MLLIKCQTPTSTMYTIQVVPLTCGGCHKCACVCIGKFLALEPDMYEVSLIPALRPLAYPV